jgi:immunity protein 22 of polymorphic toxin system
MSGQGMECRRNGLVSVWVGTFLSVEAAEAYFGIPDEIGVYLPPEGFARDLGFDDLPAESLEVNFEQVSPRTLPELLKDATFSASFIARAVEEARRQGIHEAQGVVLLYDFDYQARPGWQRAAGPLRFVGSFPFVGALTPKESAPVRDPRIEVRELTDDLL